MAEHTFSIKQILEVINDARDLADARRLIQIMKPCTKSYSDDMIVAHKVISEPGASITVSSLELHPKWQKSLNIQGPLPSGK